MPSAENLAAYGATNLEYLVEAVNKGWNKSIPASLRRFLEGNKRSIRSVGFHDVWFNDSRQLGHQMTELSLELAL